MASDSKVPSPPREIADSALDAAVGAGDSVPEETVIFQFGAIPVRSKPRSGGDPDRPVLVGGVPNPGK